MGQSTDLERNVENLKAAKKTSTVTLALDPDSNQYIITTIDYTYNPRSDGISMDTYFKYDPNNKRDRMRAAQAARTFRKDRRKLLGLDSGH